MPLARRTWDTPKHHWSVLSQIFPEAAVKKAVLFAWYADMNTLASLSPPQSRPAGINTLANPRGHVDPQGTLANRLANRLGLEPGALDGKRDDFTPGTNFRAWAFEVAKWTMRAHLKESRRKNWLVFDDDLAQTVTDRMIERVPASPDAPQAALRLCLSKLRDRDRELVLSHYERGTSLADCAKRAGSTTGTMKVALFRLRAVLRRCITERLAVEAARS